MAIKTHNSISNAGETDNQQASIAGSMPASCKHYFPCDEGAGTTTDSPNTDKLDNTDAATTLSYSVANTMRILHANAAMNTGTIHAAVGTNPFLMFYSCQVNTASAFLTCIFGDEGAATPKIGFNSGGLNVHDGTTGFTDTYNESYSGGDDIFCAVFFDGDATMTWYEAKDGATPTANTVDATSLASITLADEIQLSSGVGQDFYGFGLFVFEQPTAPTLTEVAAWLAAIQASIQSTDKTLPAAMLGTY